jgi:hypothetical protein
MTDKPSVHEREVAIVAYLHAAPEGRRTIRHVWEALQAPPPQRRETPPARTAGGGRAG